MKLSNKSVSGEAVLPLLTVLGPEQVPLLPSHLPQRRLSDGPLEGGEAHIYGGCHNVSMQASEKKLIYRNNATFSGLNIHGVINTN